MPFFEPVSNVFVVPSLGCCCCGDPKAGELNAENCVIVCNDNCLRGYQSGKCCEAAIDGARVISIQNGATPSTALVTTSPKIGISFRRKKTPGEIEHKNAQRDLRARRKYEQERARLLRQRAATAKKERTAHAEEVKLRKEQEAEEKRQKTISPRTLPPLPTPPAAIVAPLMSMEELENLIAVEDNLDFEEEEKESFEPVPMNHFNVASLLQAFKIQTVPVRGITSEVLDTLLLQTLNSTQREIATTAQAALAKYYNQPTNA